MTDTAQRRAEAWMKQHGCYDGTMLTDLVNFYQQARREALEEVAKVCNERAAFYEAEEAKAGDDQKYRLTRGIQRNEASCCAHAIDRLREGVGK